MDVFKTLGKYHGEIVDVWVGRMLSDRSAPYHREAEANLRPLVSQATAAYSLVLDGGGWDELDAFITFIARRRLAQGYKLSDVQKAFMLYQQVVTPFIIRNARDDERDEAIARLGSCISQTVGKFSDFFQGLHEEYMRQQTVVLEKEVAKRTRELSESESKYKALVEDIRDGYYVLHDGVVVFANSAFCAMHGRPMKEIVGIPFLELVAPESRGDVERSSEQSRTSQSTSLVEYFRLQSNGRKLPTEALAKISSYEGKAASLGICRDISERKELEQKTREAETLNALAQQAASLAHDIRNPLTAIKMNVQMLAAELDGNPTHHRLLEISRKEVESIERSVLEMMHLARPFRLNREIVLLRPFIQDCVDALRTRMEHKGVKASLRLSPKLDRLRIDPHRIEQTLVNLLFNAIEAVPRGGHIFVTSGRVEHQGSQWGTICVADNGPGIPAELLPYYFDEKQKRRIGLGLDNVKKVIEAHGGVVEVGIRRPRGLRVCLRLPQEQ
ncbi:sensor histidine kinase, PAS domain-containing [Geotalea daltonii FRC-32]|uniref:histidine kinase n=1 Tax=Geotalea daltonii (strain DSM 22248 / JCM 15807 / FRC-32) TaxID=316067 RepID=B9M937_GEODF|nr:ATP-binding protein [Geotalea daltonii]ACM18595.1 sensor histidine kinase, PAS domain-containing [Geotalea daltonii FRC-32]